MSIKLELEELHRASGGLLKPEDVVEWARTHQNSELHSSLEWNDAKAAHEHRVWQVRRLIAVHVIAEEGDRTLVSLTVDRVRQGGGYRDIRDVMRVDELRACLLSDALEELERVKAKYDRLTELADVWVAVHKAKTRTRSTAKEKEPA